MLLYACPVYMWHSVIVIYTHSIQYVYITICVIWAIKQKQKALSLSKGPQFVIIDSIHAIILQYIPSGSDSKL